MQYLDFDLSITSVGDGEYEVVVLNSPDGQARERVRLPFDQEQLTSWIEVLHRHSIPVPPGESSGYC